MSIVGQVEKRTQARIVALIWPPENGHHEVCYF
jgi:hypothetical protein